MFRPSRVDIDTVNLAANVRRLREWNGANFFCPMIKANAYGHGDVTCARVIAAVGVDALGVALVEEGLALRLAGITAPILVFASFDAAAARAVVEHGLTPVIGRPEHLAAFAGLSTDLHLKINVGMQRLGFDAPELGGVRTVLANNPDLRVRGVCAHLTHGEDAGQSTGPTARQLARFEALAADFPGVRHAHKSSSLAALEGRVARGQIGSRPGVALYGLAHEGHLRGAGLAPVLSWRSELAAVHHLERGDRAGYGERFVATRPTRLGVVPLGYGDGVSRRWEGRAAVLYRGRRVPVVGSVCMDYFYVDLTDADPELAKVGEPVVLIGRQQSEEITAADLAEWTDTISYEIVTAISRRVPRRDL